MSTPTPFFTTLKDSVTSERTMWMGVLFYILLLCGLCTIKYHSFMYEDFDLAIDSQSTWNITHGSIQSSIHSIPFLGNHMRLILFPIALVYAIAPFPILFLYIQSIALGLGGLGIYRIAVPEIGRRWALALGTAYLIYPPLIYMNLYEFHPVSLATCFLIYMMLAYKQERFKRTLVFLFLAMSCQENIPLIAIGFGIYAYVDGRRGKWVTWPSVCGVGYFLIAVLWIMPHYNEGTIEFYRLYGDLGNSLTEVIINCIKNPVKAVSIMLSDSKRAWMLTLLVPIGFLSLLAPKTMIPVLLVLGQRLLSQRHAEATILYHYQAEFIPFIFVSAVYGIQRVRSWKTDLRTPILIITLGILPILSMGISGIPQELLAITNHAKNPTKHRTEQKREATALISAGAPALASFSFQPKLSNRSGLYSFHHLYDGHYTLSSRRYTIPEPVKYIILDTHEPLTFSRNGFYTADGYTNILEILNPSATVSYARNGIVVIDQSPSARTLSDTSLFSLRPHTQPRWLSGSHQLSTEGFTNLYNVTLNGVTLHPATNNYRKLNCYWSTVGTTKDFNVSVALETTSESTQLTLVPGHRIWPPQSWGSNHLVRTSHYITTDQLNPDQPIVHIRMKPVPAGQPVK